MLKRVLPVTALPQFEIVATPPGAAHDNGSSDRRPSERRGGGGGRPHAGGGRPHGSGGGRNGGPGGGGRGRPGYAGSGPRGGGARADGGGYGRGGQAAAPNGNGDANGNRSFDQPRTPQPAGQQPAGHTDHSAHRGERRNSRALGTPASAAERWAWSSGATYSALRPWRRGGSAASCGWRTARRAKRPPIAPWIGASTSVRRSRQVDALRMRRVTFLHFGCKLTRVRLHPFARILSLKAALLMLLAAQLVLGLQLQVAQAVTMPMGMIATGAPAVTASDAVAKPDCATHAAHGAGTHDGTHDCCHAQRV